MLLYLDHFQNWLDYGNGLVIFLILVLFWLSETGLIWGFRAFSGKPIEEMAWKTTAWFWIPEAYFTKEVKPSLAELPFGYNGSLAKLGLTSLVK